MENSLLRILDPYLKNHFLPAFLLFFSCFTVIAQEDLPEYDELNVEMTIPDLGMMEIPIIIKGEDAFIPVETLFDRLKIKNTRTDSRLEGFIIHPDSTYQIDLQANRISFKNESFRITEADYIQTPDALYLRSDLFGKAFGLDTQFSFRSLSVKLVTDKELPVIKEMRLKKLRENMNQVKGIVQPDTTISREFSFFEAGSLDWGVITTQNTQLQNDNRFTLGLGTMFLGGEINLILNYSSRVPFESRNQFYQWRYINNDSRFIKQITAGRIFSGATSSLFAPVSGVQISNSPFQNRRSFGTYVLTDYTDPRWTVELYVNNVLVDFTEADASGFYSFDVPLMYGNTGVRLKFYGPYGEERVEERMINIPYNFVPKNELEYTISAGIVENDDLDRFSRANVNYGISNTITVGGGAEYLSGLESEEVMPFVNTSVRVASNLLFSGEYMYGVKGEAILNYRTPQNLQVELNYVNYDKDQTAINYNYLEERKISLSSPIRAKNFSLYTRFSLNQIIMPATEFTTAQLLLSGAVMGVSTNLTTYGIYNDRLKDPTIYSSLSQTYRLPYKLLFSPQLQYDFSNSRFNNIIAELERPVMDRGFLNLAYEHNFLRKAHIFEIGFRYNLNFAQTSFTSRFGNQNTSLVQSVRGSLMLDDNTGYILASDRTAMSKAALNLIPFLDYNANGKKDPMEPGVEGLELKNRMGKVSYNDDRTILRITELQPYIDLMLEVDPVSLDNIAWKISNPKIMVETVPNKFQDIYVPVEVLGEVGGMVYLEKNGSLQGQGRIIINIFDSKGQRASRILSESDGYFTYLGLKPGSYTARIDREQLTNLGYTSTPPEISFEIKVDQYGDIVDTLEFILKGDEK